MKPIIETISGRSFWPLKPKAEDIVIGDIAHALSNQCRFSGHTRFHYSVSQHSILVSKLLERDGYDVETQLWGLMHDASEAYLVDLPSPLKCNPGFAYYKVAEKRLMRAICDRFGLSRKEPDAVRWADQVLLACEVRDLMHFRKAHWDKLIEKADDLFGVGQMSPTSARERFLVRFKSLSEQRAK